MFGSQTHVNLVLVVKRFLDYSNQGLFELFVSLLSSACFCGFFFFVCLFVMMRFILFSIINILLLLYRSSLFK